MQRSKGPLVLRDARVRQEQTDPNSASVPLTGPILGQAGPIAIDLDTMREAVAEARVLRHWQSGTKPELSALKNPRMRQKVLIRAIETRLVRREVEGEI